MKSKTKDIYLFWIFVALFSIFCISKIFDHTFYKNRFVQTKAIIVSKTCKDQYRSNVPGYQRCYIEYVYSYDLDKALSYKTQETLDRGLSLQRNMRGYEDIDILMKYAPERDLSLLVIDTFRPDERVFRSFQIGQELTVEYRGDIPWKSTVIGY